MLNPTQIEKKLVGFLGDKNAPYHNSFISILFKFYEENMLLDPFFII